MFDLNPESVWNNVKIIISPDFPFDSELWLSPTKGLAFEDNTLVIEVPNEYFKSRLEECFDLILKALKKYVKSDSISLKFVLSSNPNVYTAEHRDKLPEPTYQPENETAFNSYLNPRYTFDSFIIGATNRFAQAVAEAVANDPGKTYNPLFIYGGAGLGKTHLLHAIGHSIKSKFPSKNILYVTFDKILSQFIESFKNKSTGPVFNKYLSVDVLLIDDIQSISKSEAVQDQFFLIFNELIDSNKQIVITSDKSPDQLPVLEDRLRSRFQWGVIADIQPPDLETRIAILESKAEVENFLMPKDIIYFIATHIKDNVRKLQGALIRTAAHTSLTGSELTVENVKDILKDVLSDEEKLVNITIDSIKEVVSRHYSVTVKDIDSKSRRQKIVFPRHLTMHLCRKLTSYSLSDIGRETGGRDHAAVIYAEKIINKKLEEDIFLRKLVDKLVNEIKFKS